MNPNPNVMTGGAASDSQQIQISIEQAKALVATGEAILRLSQNADFKAVIEEAYLRDEALRLVHLKADPSQADDRAQTIIDRDIHAIGSLGAFLDNIMRHARVMQGSLEQYEAERARAEEEEEMDNPGGAPLQ